MTRPIPQCAIDLVKEFEGCVLQAYPDPATHGDPWTVGYGHTGPDVHPRVHISQAQADAFLMRDLREAAGKIAARIGPVVDELSDNQYGALLSFVFNLSDGNRSKPEWTIWKLLRARKFDKVHGEFGKFVNAAGRPMAGLVRRRAAEAALWLSGAPEVAIPSSVTRTTPTPPTVAPVKPLLQSKSFMTSAATTVAAGAAGVGEVSKAVSPYAQSSEIVARMVSTLAMLAAVLAVATLAFVWWKNRKAGQS